MNIEDVLTKLRDIRAAQQAKMILGTCGGGQTIDGQMINYRVAVVVNVELSKIIDQIEKDMNAKSAASEASLEPQEEAVDITDAYEEEA